MSIQISVTAKDITNGEIGSGSQCPVAIAVERALKRYRISELEVEVGSNRGGYITLHSTHGGTGLKMAKKVAWFVNHFDDANPDAPAKPFSFALPIERMLKVLKPAKRKGKKKA